jgi:hypothetical protein
MFQDAQAALALDLSPVSLEGDLQAQVIEQEAHTLRTLRGSPYSHSHVIFSPNTPRCPRPERQARSFTKPPPCHAAEADG